MMTTFPKLTTVDTNNLQPEELIHLDFSLYILNSIHVFTSMITVSCAKTIILCVFPNAYEQYPFHIICLIITTLNNEQHP